MASALTTSGKNEVLDSGSNWPPAFLSVHSVDAPTDNTTEPSGGSPAYARTPRARSGRSPIPR